MAARKSSLKSCLKSCLAGAAAGLSVMFAASVAQATCAAPHEQSALQARVLQSELMVAALSCGERARYNAFVRKYETALVDYGQDLKAFYTRTYGRHGERELGRLVTRLANDASQRSLNVSSRTFCADAVALFDQLSRGDAGDLQAVIADNPNATNHGVQACAQVAEQVDIQIKKSN